MNRGVLVVVLSGALVLAGCGIPDNTDVAKVGSASGPAVGMASGTDAENIRPTREQADDRTELAKSYLSAAAASDPDASLKQVQSFLSPSAATTFKAPSDIKIIHTVDEPLVNPGSDEVLIQALTVGLLKHNGTIEPSPETGVVTYTLTVSGITGKTGLFVTKAPQVLLLTDDALDTYYDPHTIYFWNPEHTALVPDVRYLSDDVPREQAPQEIIKWMIEGPAAWLTGAVEPLPEGAALIGNVPAESEGKLRINLSDTSVEPPDDPNALDRLRRQLMWSLRTFLPRVLELKIGNQSQTDYDGNDYLTSNAAYRMAESPERFVIYAGQVKRVTGSPGAADPIPVIRPEANHDVTAAAFARSFSDRRYAALVTSAKGVTSLQVGSVAMGERADLRRVALPSGPAGQPVWALTSDDAQTGALGLITVGGRLYSFSADGAPLREVVWPGPPGAITAAAVAPDGRRVALVAGGKLFVAAMTADGDGTELSTPRRVETERLRDVTAVDWGTETSLVVAGTLRVRERVAIIQTGIDGAYSSEVLADIGTDHVSYLATYPVSPYSGKGGPDVMQYMAKGAAFDILSGAVRIGVADLAEPVENPAPKVVPVAPFYLR
ncbi:LpqB family beta-propeller domain-containing protein [Actinoplanes sp. NPDC051494]|uniref:LpqB family beta-propeller domain-containing protein n=1 Tax=Actinoplanes sp. NPDC051494 TaxID=3363907 RepID=UPI0037B66668